MKHPALNKEADALVSAAIVRARKYRCAQIGVLQLLQVLLEGSSAGEDWAKQNGFSALSLAKKLGEHLSRSDLPQSEHTEPSPEYLGVMRLARIYAATNNHAFVTPQSILAALLEDESVRKWLEEETGQEIYSPVLQRTDLLSRFGRDLTVLARESKLKRAYGRESEIQQILEILMQKGKNNCLLIGPAGVGKTAIVEQLAIEIIAHNVPVRFRSKRLFEVSMGRLISNTQYRGEFEARLQELLAEAKRDGETILVIDEFHTVMGSGRIEGGTIDAANMLKPALARGEITVIGITTEAEYADFIERDQAFARRFQIVRIEEVNPEATLEILYRIAPDYEAHHGLKAPPETLQRLVALCAEFIPNRYFPDKAIDILGRSFARAEMEGEEVLRSELVADVIKKSTGIPLVEAQQSVPSHVRNLERILGEIIIGQPDAIRQVSELVQLAYVGLRATNQPRGIMLFTGPSGVGKTALAKALALTLFGSEKRLIRLDMSEFNERWDISKLVGAAPGYIGHDRPGILSEPLRNQPYAVVLLDEIEKAHPEVYDLFLQIFDEGRLTDSQGRVVDCRHAFFVMTSNLGTSEAGRMVGFINPIQDPPDTLSMLKQHFRPEFLNRIDRIITFNSLTLEDLIDIAEIEMETLQERLRAQSVRLTYEQSVLDLLAIKSQTSTRGARGLKGLIEKTVGSLISEYLMEGREEDLWLNISVHQSEIEIEKI